MTLPIHCLPTVERWSCHQCGVCCRGSLVPLSAEDVARLDSQKWQERPEYRQRPVMVRQRLLGHEHRLAQREDGSCVFLLPDGLCRIHKEFGFDAKPLVCRMFPLQIVPRDNVAYVTIRRACPSAAADRGMPVEEQLDFARQLARERRLADEAPTPPPIKPGEQRDWRVARRLLATFERLLIDEHYPPVRRLVHALAFCRLLHDARTRSLADRQLGELFEVLEQNVAGEVSELFTKRQRPGAAAGVLFRQTAAEFVRLYPGLDARPGWGERWRLAIAALKLVRGRGRLPALHPLLPAATFADLEQPLGTLDAAIYQPLARMIETTAVSWSYALANRGGWSIIESVRMLALLYPIGLWILRWQAHGRATAADDMPPIITALDRGQGYAPLAGSKQRWRLQTLASLGELEQLVTWYAR
jgi:lysine-N-methylase